MYCSFFAPDGFIAPDTVDLTKDMHSHELASTQTRQDQLPTYYSLLCLNYRS